MRILCIDDDPFYLKVLEKAFKNECNCSELEITTVTDAIAGIELFNNQQFDLVLTDLVMPKMSGLEVIRQVQQKSPCTEVIVLSAMGSIDSAVEAMKAGARDFLTKPINIAILREKLYTMRDLFDRRKEAEDYRHAKECIETNAQNQLECMSLKIEQLQMTMLNIQAILDGSLSHDDQIEQIQTVLELQQTQTE